MKSAAVLELIKFSAGELQDQKGLPELLIYHLTAGSHPALRYISLQLSQAGF